MMTRVTMQTMAAAAQRNLQASSAKLAQLQQSATDLKTFSNVSDNPAAAADAMAVRAQQAAAAQYGRNISDGSAWLTTADNALASATTLLQNAKDLTLQGANGAINQDGRDAIAAQLDSIGKDLLSKANTQYMGRSIFAGNSSAGAAYTDGNPPVYNGDASTVERRISPNTTIQVDANGAAIFGPDKNGDSVFGLLKTIADTLRGGGDVSAHIDAMDKALSTVINGSAEVGARHAQLLRAQDANANAVVDLENQRSGIEDLDLSKAYLDVKTQEVSYQAALGVTAKVLQPTLMDFLR
ncbi:flagellar hook-associated protein FlgL [Arthrobacter wenxiniae]|jgi:flagellar hook-associated protein 3 FlgL|uniref:Flagellar hook-associated protein 3 n=1 Tax=Arthrobacter wenxiniae TaxID=2713570 RepID=A0A7Y7IIS6_9MICC|nr:flagellar hook-associated protein FlgL [Arthrobacter wenxiniae]NVM96244.1 flagellar hook-associated protein 3 [Arthrobacter wenxiniae]